MGKGLVEVLHDLESRVEQLEKARDERNRDYVELAKEYQEVLDQFVEHLQVEISTLCNKDLPLHVCVARVIDAASSKRHLLEKRAEKLRKAVELIEKAFGQNPGQNPGSKEFQMSLHGIPEECRDESWHGGMETEEKK